MAKKVQPEKPRAMTRRAISHHQKAQRRQRFIFFGGIGIIAIVVVLVIVGVIVGEVLPNSKTVLAIADQEYDYGYYVDALKVQSILQSEAKPSDVNAQLPQAIQQYQMLRDGAASLNITISDNEVKDKIKEIGLEANDATMDMIRAQLLIPKLKEHFGTKIAETMPQVNLEAILVESEAVARDIRQELADSDNITELAKEYGLNYYSQNDYMGAFGWHPASIHEDYLGTSIPVDWAFEAEAGDVSQPLSDNETWKKKGYWLLRVNSIEEEAVSENETAVSANVSGILLNSEEQAKSIRERLNNGEDLAAIAEEFSQYSVSKQNGGELGVFEKPSDNTTHALSEATDPYIFGEDTETGVWSDPIPDEGYWTQGGAWLVRAVDVDENRAVSEEDRTFLINEQFDNWMTLLSSNAVYQPVNTLSDEQKVEAIAEAERYLAGMANRA